MSTFLKLFLLVQKTDGNSNKYHLLFSCFIIDIHFIYSGSKYFNIVVIFSKKI